MSTVYLALGSNLGDRQALLDEAQDRLHHAGVVVRRRSSVIETEPRYFLDQPNFLNMAVEAETELSPQELLAVTQNVERELGRQRKIDKGPRTIDIDILFYDDIVQQSADLTLPHPLLQERDFVLRPLAEIAPDLRHPLLNQTVAELLAAL